MEPLTPAELRTLYLLARFETAVEAAEFAGLSPQTIRNQLHHAFEKLGVDGRLAAFRKLGWLRPPQFMPSPDAPILGEESEGDRPSGDIAAIGVAARAPIDGAHQEDARPPESVNIKGALYAP